MASKPGVPPVSKKPDVRRALEEGEGILRLAPCWVPRTFAMPGRRLRLHPNDYYGLGTHRGGIDERWLASTVDAANENRQPDEGLSYVVHGDGRFTLHDAVEAEGMRLLGKAMWERHRRWPVFAKFFDNVGPIPHHIHQSDAQANLVGLEGKPESYYFPPQLNNVLNSFPHTYFGLEAGTTKEDIRQCLEKWGDGDNGILDYSRAYRLKLGTGWLLPPSILHAPGSLLTYEVQWGSDVFAMFQSMVDGRPIPWEMLTKDVPKDKQQDLDYIVDLLNWDANTNSHFKESHYLEPIPIADSAGEGWLDQWIVYGKIDGEQRFSGRELTIDPGARCVIRDDGAYGLIAVQGSGRIGKTRLDSPVMIRLGEMTEDEVFVSYEAATKGVTLENTGAEPLVTLRYFGPEACRGVPEVGDHKKRQ